MRQPPGPDDPSTVGRFRIVGVLGAGGMGRVLLGEDPSGRLAAVKLVHAELVDSDGFRARFRREVRMAAQAPPGWTAPFLDADPDAPQPWLATAYLDAPSLAEYLEDGWCDPADAAGIGSGLAAALSALHAAGLVHRDLKPSNVLLTDGGPRLIDFGISRAVDATALTAIGQTVGTPEYMSPEQVNGGEAGPASDVFALGSLLVFATTGRTPFAAGSTAATLYRVVHAEPHLGDGLGPLEPVVRACLAKDPAARPPASWIRQQTALLAGNDDGTGNDTEGMNASDGGVRDAAAPLTTGRAGRHGGPDTGEPAVPLPRPGSPGPGSTSPYPAGPGSTYPYPAAPGSTSPYPAATGRAAPHPAGPGSPSPLPAAPGPASPRASGPGWSAHPVATPLLAHPSGRPATAPLPPAPLPPGAIPAARVPRDRAPGDRAGSSRQRTPLLAAGAVLLAVLLGVGGTLGVLALRSTSATSATTAAPQANTANPFLAGGGTPSVQAAPETDPAAGATLVDTSADTRFNAPYGGGLQFTSPSGNIACTVAPDGADCDVAERNWQLPPKPADCPLAFGTGVGLGGTGPATLSCVGGLSADPSAAHLDYDRALRTGDVVCVSRTAGVECRNTRTGHGFAVSRATYRLY